MARLQLPPVPIPGGEAAEQAFDRRSHPSVLGLYHLRFSEFYRFDFRPSAPPHQGIADIYKFYQIDGFQPFQAAFFRGSGDFYFVDPDFEWAYIVTHEPELGPYFCHKGHLAKQASALRRACFFCTQDLSGGYWVQRSCNAFYHELSDIMEYQIYKVTEGVTSSMIPADTGRVLDILSKLEASFQGPYTGVYLDQ